ncbi:MAG: SGNH/GDSL hydrolase family protein [Nitrosospira sp.]|nr:SGNH/GDSL hydrolase family protein [Nitrosospira sp.]
MKIRVLFSFCAVLLTGGNVWAAGFSGLYTFGDSLSDVGDSPSAVMSIYKSLGGNCDPFHPCGPFGPYDHGRFTNGPVASEYLAAALFPTPPGVATPNFYSYAVGGATSGIGNYGDGGTATKAGDKIPLPVPGIFPLPAMQGELQQYMKDSGGMADPNALYFVWGGANDYLTHDDPKLAAQNISGYVSELAAAGANHFLVPNLADLGRTPFAITHNDVGAAQSFSLQFNAELAAQLGTVSSAFPAAHIFQFDTYSFLNGVIQNPGSFGFTDVQNSCLDGLSPCGSPDSHLFWDDFHPTTKGHGIIGSAFASAVPEPEMVLMYSMGLLVLGMAGSKRRPLKQTVHG